MNDSKSINSDIYLSSAWQQHADLITHLCHFSQNILLVLGQKQAGKSTFFEHYIHAPFAGLKICALKADNAKTVEELLKEVALGFGLNWDSASNLTQEVKNQAITSYQIAHETWMLMIDDAHLLDDTQMSALLQLVQFNDEARQQLHLVLLGEPSLEGRLFSPNFAASVQGKVYSIELEPWTLHDVKRYFYSDALLRQLEPEHVAAIFERSQGLPGRVIQEQLLLQGSTKGAKTMTKQNAKRWTHPIALGAVAGFLLGGSYLLLNSTQEEEAVNAPVNAAQVENIHLDNSDEKMAMEEEPAPIVKETIAVAPKMPSTTTQSTQVEEQGAATTAATTTVAALEPPAQNTEMTVTQATTPTPAPQQLQAPAPVPAPVATTTIATPEVSTQAMQAAPKVAVKSSEPKKPMSKEEEYLLSVDKNFYTLQLVGARNENSVKQFIQKHELDEHAYVYRTKLSGKDWYVVVLGEYATMDEAKVAASGLPTHIAAKPWIREFTSIHSDIQKQG
ncbi:MAG: SPOR domain-containing protein [Candidatus Berkiella sp.]